MDFHSIYNAALETAIRAAQAYDITLPPESKRGFDCGFAWVDVPCQKTTSDTTKAFVKWCRENKSGEKRGYGKAAWQFWNPSKHNTQSVGTKEAGAAAFASILRLHGIECSVGTRLD